MENQYKMEYRVTQPGNAKYLPVIRGCDYQGLEVIEDTQAVVPSLYLKVYDRDGTTCIELTLDKARQLAEQLVWLADNHFSLGGKS
jgi:hypothetical protein